jgi:hypothetical protein
VGRIGLGRSRKEVNVSFGEISCCFSGIEYDYAIISLKESGD